jgi:Dullard-like phosphatase family protein
MSIEVKVPENGKENIENKNKTKSEKDDKNSISKNSENFTSSSSINESKDEESVEFETNFKKFYVDPSQNTPLNFDNYVQYGLKLISYFPIENDFEKQIREKKICLCKEKNFDINKKTLVVDMDETLIHGDVDFQFKYHDEILKFNFGNENDILIPLIIRPHLFEFLDYASENFNLIVFTASDKNYANSILNFIEKKKKYFIKRLFRDSCVYLNPGISIKDLRIFSDVTLNNIILVDNSIFAFANQLSNGVLISSFYNDINDFMLENLIDYLGILLNVKDVREINEQSFQFETYLLNIKKNCKLMIK